MSTRKIAVLVLATAVLVLGSYLYNTTNPFTVKAEPEQISIPVESFPAASHAMKSSDEQIAFWQQKVQRDDRDYISLTYLGQAYLQKGRETGDAAAYSRAQTALEQALTINPNYELTLAFLGVTQIAQHNFAGALETAQRVYDFDPVRCKRWSSLAMPVWSWGATTRPKLPTNCCLNRHRERPYLAVPPG